MKDNYVLIMAGGVGSRFWPKSRDHFPKQFIDILGIGKSLLQLTYERFSGICPADQIYVLSNAQYIDLIREQLPTLPLANIIAEPSRNNTAPCIAYASFKIAKLNPEANIVVAPSDHLVLQDAVFKDKINAGLQYAAQHEVLVTLGVEPNRPDTGYGYIKYEKEGDRGVHHVERFLEKPDLERAKSFLLSGDYLWNAGIFIWRAQTILQALASYSPAIYALFQKGAELYNTEKEAVFIKENYPLSPNISIDYAVMEKAENVYTIPSDFGWSDLGTWASLYEVSAKDAHQNVGHGYHLNLTDTNNCMIQLPPDKVAVIKGLENYIVVDDGKVLLIYPKANEQEIKAASKQVTESCGLAFS